MLEKSKVETDYISYKCRLIVDSIISLLLYVRTSSDEL